MVDKMLSWFVLELTIFIMSIVDAFPRILRDRFWVWVERQYPKKT